MQWGLNSQVKALFVEFTSCQPVFQSIANYASKHRGSLLERVGRQWGFIMERPRIDRANIWPDLLISMY